MSLSKQIKALLTLDDAGHAGIKVPYVRRIRDEAGETVEKRFAQPRLFFVQVTIASPTTWGETTALPQKEKKQRF